MEPMTIAMLVGAGLGALKSNEEKNMWADQQKAEAEKTRYAPWTGQWGKTLDGPTGDVANIAAGTMAGAAMGQRMGKGSSSPNNDNTNLKLNELDLTDEEWFDDTRPSDNFYRRQKERRLLDPYEGSLYS